MDACLERSPHIQLVVGRLIRCAHAATLLEKSKVKLTILLKGTLVGFEGFVRVYN